MKANDVNKVQKAVKKSETETLTGAVKGGVMVAMSIRSRRATDLD